MCDNLLILNDLNESYIAASVDLMLLVLFRAGPRRLEPAHHGVDGEATSITRL